MKISVNGLLISIMICTSFAGFNPMLPAWSYENPATLASEIRKMAQNPKETKIQDLQDWVKRVEPVIPKFNPIGLSITLYSLSNLKKAGVLRSALPESFTQAWTQAALEKLNAFNSQSLSNIIYALSVLRIHPGEAFIQAWERKAQDSIHTFTSQALSNSIYALSGLEIHPGETFIQAWERKAQDSIDTFKPQELSNSIYALSVLGIHPGEMFIQAWERKAQDSIHTFTSQALSNSIYAFSLLGIRPGNPFFLAWKKQIVKKMSGFEGVNLHQLYLARNFLFAKYKADFPQKLTLRLKTAIPEFKNLVDLTTSHTQNRVAQDLKQLYPNDLHEEYWADATASYIDFAVPSLNLMIQFDGPHHFIRFKGNMIPKAKDKMMDFILCNEGWKVLRLSYLDWNRIKNRPKDERIKELRKILEKAAKCSDSTMIHGQGRT